MCGRKVFIIEPPAPPSSPPASGLRMPSKSKREARALQEQVLASRCPGELPPSIMENADVVCFCMQRGGCLLHPEPDLSFEWPHEKKEREATKAIEKAAMEATRAIEKKQRKEAAERKEVEKQARADEAQRRRETKELAAKQKDRRSRRRGRSTGATAGDTQPTEARKKSGSRGQKKRNKTRHAGS